MRDKKSTLSNFTVCWGAGACLGKLYKTIKKHIGDFKVIDSDSEKWGKMILPGVLCVSPGSIGDKDDILVLITVDKKNTQNEIEKSIREVGIKNYISVYEWIEKIHPHIENYDEKNRKCTINERECKEVQQEDLTFVVSGKLSYDGTYSTLDSIQSIKKFYPNAQIILSTWASEEIRPIEDLCTKVIQIEEPSFEEMFFLDEVKNNRPNSINKQQLSVNAGMKLATTDYIVRLRSDFILLNDNALKFYNLNRKKYQCFGEEFKAFEDRVLAYQGFMYNPYYFCGSFSYMLSDCFLIGKKTDILQLWDGHQESLSEISYFRSNKDNYENPDRFCHRYNAEQYFLINALKKAAVDVKFPRYYFDDDKEAARDYFYILASNMIVGNGNNLGLCSKFDNDHMELFITMDDISRVYEQCCNNIR